MILSNEDIEWALQGKPEINRAANIKRLQFLASKAEPGNWAWKTLEDEYGFVGDYSEADWGEAPKGAQW